MTLIDVLGKLGVARDVDLIGGGGLVCATAGGGRIRVRGKGGIVFKHRFTSDSEVYFLADTSDRPADFTASFRVAGRKPTLWMNNNIGREGITKDLIWMMDVGIGGMLWMEVSATVWAPRRETTSGLG